MEIKAFQMIQSNQILNIFVFTLTDIQFFASFSHREMVCKRWSIENIELMLMNDAKQDFGYNFGRKTIGISKNKNLISGSAELSSNPSERNNFFISLYHYEDRSYRNTVFSGHTMRYAM